MFRLFVAIFGIFSIGMVKALHLKITPRQCTNTKTKFNASCRVVFCLSFDTHLAVCLGISAFAHNVAIIDFLPNAIRLCFILSRVSTLPSRMALNYSAAIALSHFVNEEKRDFVWW